jgi:hypothetical protein
MKKFSRTNAYSKLTNELVWVITFEVFFAFMKIGIEHETTLNVLGIFYNIICFITYIIVNWYNEISLSEFYSFYKVPSSNFIFYIWNRYVQDPENNKVTNNWLSGGEYEIEALGVRYPATLHLKSPFDSKNLRIQGEYNLEELRYIFPYNCTWNYIISTK